MGLLSLRMGNTNSYNTSSNKKNRKASFLSSDHSRVNLSFYLVVNSGLCYTQDVYFVTVEILVVSAFNYTYSINSLYSAMLPHCCELTMHSTH